MKAVFLIPLALLGAGYFPMAVLAVAMSDSVLAVNPLVVVPAILKVPLEYLVVLMVAGTAVAARLAGTLVLPAILPVMVVPGLIGTFLALYLATVLMRLLGLMYCANRDKLGWFKR